MSTHTMRISLIFSRALVFSSSCLWEACLAAQTPDRTGHTPYHAPWDESKKLTRALDRTVDFPGIDDRKTELGQVLDGLEKKYGLTFTVNERAFDEVKLDDVRKIKIAEFGAIPSMKTTLGTVLKKILNRVPDNSHATYLIRSDSIEITTQATWFRELGLPPHTDSYRLVKEQFRKMELRKALEVLGADVLIDIRVEKQARTKVNARLYYVPVEAAVELLADMAGLEVVPREGTFYVTSPDNAARMKTALDARARRPSDEKDLFFRAGLRSLISIRSGNTLQRAMEATGEEGGVNLLIDPRVEKKLRVRLPNRLAFFPTPTVLELLADMAGLAVVKRSNVYYVTSPDNADRLQKGNAKRTDKDATSDGRANGKQPRRLRP